jgi:hypothetical protein
VPKSDKVLPGVERAASLSESQYADERFALPSRNSLKAVALETPVSFLLLNLLMCRTGRRFKPIKEVTV